eukprot:jgi/Tetstr1/440159/TSEL_028515.t1
MENGELSRALVSEQPMDCCFHPGASLLAGAVITGHVQVFKYEGEATQRVFDLAAHTESCRAVRFTSEGSLLLSASADCSILATDTATGAAAARLENAHSCGVNTLECIDATVLASGDDDGTVKLWDVRQRQAIASFETHGDFISDFSYSPDNNALVASSGDGSISIYDMAARKLIAQSEDDADDELLSVVVLKNGKKLVSGSQEGVILLYSWGYFNDCSDRFPGHPNSIDALVKFDEDTMLGVVGEHAEYPIECLALSGDKKLLASASHDNSIKLWDISYLHEAEDAEDAEPESSSLLHPGGGSDMSDSDDEGSSKKKGTKAEKTRMKGKGKGKGKATGGANFFEDML